MADVITQYRKKRMTYLYGFCKIEDFDPILDSNKRDLDRLARFLTRSIQNEEYDQPQPVYPLADLAVLERIHRRKGTLPRQDAVDSIHHILEDYLKPKEEQAYTFGPHLGAALYFIFKLDLEDILDIDLLNRVIKNARDGGHRSVANGWSDIRRKINRKRLRKS